MRIALINPPFREVRHTLNPSFPLGLGYIKAVCDKNGYYCDLFDFSVTKLSNNDLLKKYKLSDYNIVGISSYSLFFNETAKLVKEIKSDNNIIIVGGHHASLVKGRILEDFSDVDYCLVGFAEYSFLYFVKNIEKAEMYETPGLCYRIDGGIIENPVDYENFKLDNIPFPNRDDIYYDYDKNSTIDISKKVINVSSSRGCPYHCTYCVNCKNNYWLTRSIDNVIREIDLKFEKNNYNIINFIDCNYFVDPKRAVKIIEEIKVHHPNVSFSFQTRSDQIVNNEVIIKKLLKQYDCNITIGIESNSDIVLKRYKKQTSSIINQKAIDVLKSLDAQIVVYMIMFEALETLYDVRASFDFLKKNNLFNYNTTNNLFQTLVPFYNSAYYDEYKEYYSGDIHERTNPIFVNDDVASLHHVMCLFRNEYEDIIEEKIVLLHANLTKNMDSQKDLFFLMRVAYLVFEYFLIMCEKFGKCYYEEFKNSVICNMLDNMIAKYS